MIVTIKPQPRAAERLDARQPDAERLDADRPLRAGAGLRRTGGIAVIVVVLLALLAATVGAMTRSMMSERLLVQTGQMRTQAEWLCESAFHRAAVKLKADPAWPGETWTLPASELTLTDGAVTQIAVVKPVAPATTDGAAPADSPVPARRRQVDIVVQCPLEGPPLARVERSYFIDAGP